MNGTSIAGTYAKALMTPDLSVEAMQKKMHDLETVLKAVTADKNTKRFFDSPQITDEKKKAVLDKSLKGVDDDVAAFLSLLVEKKRFGLLPGIVKECNRIADKRQGILKGTLTTAYPVDGGELKRIASKLGTRYKKTIVLTAETDPDLIAGGVLIVGTDRIDFSAKGKLDKLKSDLISMPLAKRS